MGEQDPVVHLRPLLRVVRRLCGVRGLRLSPRPMLPQEGAGFTHAQAKRHHSIEIPRAECFEKVGHTKRATPRGNISNYRPRGTGPQFPHKREKFDLKSCRSEVSAVAELVGWMRAARPPGGVVAAQMQVQTFCRCRRSRVLRT